MLVGYGAPEELARFTSRPDRTVRVPGHPDEAGPPVLDAVAHGDRAHIHVSRRSNAEPARAAWRVRLGPYVLTVGGIEPRKGSLDLIEAYAVLRAARPDARPVIASGENLFDYREYRARWEARAAGPGIEPVVLGGVPEAALPSLVAA
ncbi:hypothetical protein [Streptomyces sp. NPDC090798]|uniref:hypothetical protein n=1 Tax=Streptomyces sp. NPDC090798 TaxID=3365968 RepID=UPI0037FF5C31